MDDLGKKLGGWYDLIRQVDQIDGRWVRCRLHLHS
jgi:hypothetical protein